MPVDPQVEKLLPQLNALQALDLATIPPPLFRQMTSQMPRPAGEPVARVEDRRVPGPAGDVPVRIYAHDARGPQPALLYFHGGGFVIGDLESHDASCRGLANAAGCTVIAVDYRLAPEAKFPAAPDDCHAALAWAVEHAGELGIDAARIAVGGDSAGGNLAAVVALMARERGPALAHQLLIYPVTDFAFDTPSYEQNAQGYLLSRDMMRWFWDHYLADAKDGRDPRASPLRAQDLAGLPTATVITAEYDPLRDEGEAYAARLLDFGVPVELRRYDGMIHGFFGMTDQLDRAKDAVNWAASRLRAAFGS